MKFTLTLLFSTLSILSFGQKVRYLNQNFVQVSYKDQATYYTETFASGPVAGTVKTYTLNGTLLWEEAFSDIKKQVRHGITRKYFPDGKLKAEITFQDGVYDGPLQTFYPNERLRRAELFEKGNLVKGKCLSRAGYDTTYFAYQVNPQFKGGDQALDAYLSKQSRYPLTPVSDADIRRGFVKYAVVNFTVNPEGKISDVILTRSIADFMLPRSAGANFDREAVRLVSTMPAWQPGKEDGEPVASQEWLIIGFK